MLSLVMSLLMIRAVLVVYPVAGAVLVAIDHIQLLTVVKFYLDGLVLVKPSLGLSHMVPVIVIWLPFLQTNVFFLQS